MKYNEIVDRWSKESENFFNYRFDVSSNFSKVYLFIAAQLGIEEGNRLNKNMEVFPLTEKDENVLIHNSYSMVGAVSYEKRGWASIGLRLLVDSNIAANLKCNEGEYRFCFYMKPVSDIWYFFIDEYYYKDNLLDNILINSEKTFATALCNSSQENYKEKIMDYIRNNIVSKVKVNWNQTYKAELLEKYKQIYETIKAELDIKDNYLEFIPKKLDSKKETKKFEINDCLQYEINDWCSINLKLLLERAPNIYPKTNYLYSFYIKHDLTTNKWLFSMNEQFYNKEFQQDLDFSSHDCIKKIIELFDKVTLASSSFQRWLEDK